MKLFHPKGNQSWIFIDAEAPILWPPDAKNWLNGKDSDSGKVWRQEKKGMTEDEMVGWHHPLNAHEFEQALGVGEGQGSLACCRPSGRKELDTAEWLSWTKRNASSKWSLICKWSYVIWWSNISGKEHQLWVPLNYVLLIWFSFSAIGRRNKALDKAWWHLDVFPYGHKLHTPPNTKIFSK